MDLVLQQALKILEFIIALGLLIFLHELGHYLTCKLFKVEVEEFGFGFPPRIARLFVFQGTLFSLNALPFGAFVKPKGENDPEIAGGLAAAAPLKRLVVLFGGPAMNLVAGVILFAILFSRVGAPDRSSVMIAGVVENSPAEAAGIKSQDIVLKINGVPITRTDQMSTTIRSNLGNELTFTILRDNQVLEIKGTPRTSWPSNEGPLGVQLTNPVKRVNFFQSIPEGMIMVYDQTRELVLLPGRLIKGQISKEEARVVSFVGIYAIYQQAKGLNQKLWFLGVISVALGLTNLLPIPALDGGRILFVLPELITRKRIPAQFETVVHFVGFAALILFMIYTVAQDIINPIIP